MSKNSRIIGMHAPVQEREVKLVPVDPQESGQSVEDVMAYIGSLPDRFVTETHPDLAPHRFGDPSKHRPYLVPKEDSDARDRIYFLDEKMKVRDKKIEVRIEHKTYGGKQIVKYGNGASLQDPVFDRMESSGEIRGLKPIFAAVSDPHTRKLLKQEFNQDEMLPLIRVVSQRIKKKYHPDGDKKIVIEVAADVILDGATVFGRTWSQPLLELEIKKGAASHAEALKILQREASHLCRHFNLQVFTLSNPALAYEGLEEDLRNPKHAKLIETLRTGTDWYSTPQKRQKWGLE